MTRDGFERLEAELARLATVQRPAVLKQIQRVTSFTSPAQGDDAANAGRFDLDMLDRQIAHLEAVLGRAQVIQARPDANSVQAGSQVTVRYEDGTEETLTLVGPLEADPERGLVSIESPAGKALLAKPAGATVNVVSADDSLSLVVVSVNPDGEGADSGQQLGV